MDSPYGAYGAFSGWNQVMEWGPFTVVEDITQHRQLLNLTMIPRYENASAFHQTEWVDLNTISITLVANVAMWLLALTYFWSSRRHHPGCFSSKRYYVPDATPPDLPSSGFFSWIFPLLAIPEEDILAYAGFDAAIFLRFYAVAFKVFAAMAPYGLLVLIPVNMNESQSWIGDVKHASSINTFNRLSMSNIQDYDPRMWLHALGIYFLTALSMYFLLVEYRHYTNLRHRFLRLKSAHQRTIVVEGVPKEMRSDSKLFTYFNTLYPDEVVNVHIPQDLSYLRRLIRQRQGVLDNLGRGLAEKAVRGEEQYHYIGGWFCRRKRVNTVGFCSQQLDRLNLAIATEQDKRTPRQRRLSAWGAALPSISSVDMSYEVNTKPEAGPIERVVMQENICEDMDLSDSEGSDERGRRGGAGAPAAADPASADDPAAAANGRPSATDDDLTVTYPGFKGTSKDLQDLETGGHGRSKMSSRKGSAIGFSEEKMLSERETLQKQEEYWGKGYGAARGGSPRRASGEGRWGSPSRPCVAPRLSVDLIHVDPVKEAVKHTAQTLKDMRMSTFSYLGNKGRDYGPSGGGESKTSGGRQNVVGNKRSGSINGLLSDSRGRSSEAMTLLPRGHPRRMSKRMRPRYSSRAFVTFRSFSAATVARQVLHCARPGRMAARSAPEPWDVYWPNAIVTRRQHTARRISVEILLMVLMLLFPVLVTMLSFVFSSENIMQRSRMIKALCKRSSLFQSLIELIQPTCVIIVMSTLPLLLRWVGHLEGKLAESWIQMETLSRFFMFQVLNVFLVTTVAGFAVEILTSQVQAQIVQRLLAHPAVLFTLLGETLPKVCGFFCDYVIIRAFTGLSMELVRAYKVLPWLLGLITRRNKWARSPYEFAIESHRQRFDSNTSNTSCAGVGVRSNGGVGVASGGRAWANNNGSASGASSPTMSQSSNSRKVPHPGCFFYGQVYAQDLLVMVVVMTYANVAPVVLIPALMFFLMGQIVYRHQLLYVYVPKFESGGSFFPKVFRRWIFALFTAQATMIGMCLLKQGFKQAYSVMFLMVLTYAFKRKLRSTYEPVSFSLPLEIARGLDLDRAENAPEAQEEDEALHPAAKEYLQPELREPAFLGQEDLLNGPAGSDETFG